MNNMKNTNVVYTALFGGYDNLNEIKKKDPLCDYICFTEDKNLDAKNWTLIVVDEIGNPSEINRRYKFFPHKFLSNYEASLYVDANIGLSGNISDIFNKYEGRRDKIFCPKHPIRDCVYDEIESCIADGKISPAEGHALQVEMLNNDFPKRAGLFENNIILRWHDFDDLDCLMNAWWDSYKNGPKRDQLSLVYLAWKQGVTIGELLESSRNKSPYFRYYLHKREMSLSMFKRVRLLWKARNINNAYYKLLLDMKRKLTRF